MQERIIATADPGSSNISLCVCSIMAGTAKVLFYESAPSEGISCGTVFNPSKAAGVLGKLISNAETELGLEITKVVLPFPRYKIRMQKGEFTQQRSNPSEYITSAEVETICDMALSDGLSQTKQGEDIYYLAPQSFSTEDLFQANQDDVTGCSGKELSVQYNLVFGPGNAARYLEQMVTLCKKSVGARYFLPAKMGDVILTEDEMENGVALVEIGAGVTSVSIYNRGMLRYYASIPFGGKTVTNDIKLETGFAETLCENIKLAYGFCMPDRLHNMSEKILQILDDRNGGDNQLSVKYLSEIIHSRMKELAKAVLYKISESGYSDRLRSGIVLCGGGAQIVNCAALFHELSGCAVRVGYAHSATVDSSGCQGLDDTLSLGHYALISLCAQDEYIGCSCGEINVSSKNTSGPEHPIPGNGKIFADEEFGDPITPPVKETRHTTRPRKTYKPDPNSLIGRLFQGINDNYDNMGKEDN